MDNLKKEQTGTIHDEKLVVQLQTRPERKISFQQITKPIAVVKPVQNLSTKAEEHQIPATHAGMNGNQNHRAQARNLRQPPSPRAFYVFERHDYDDQPRPSRSQYYTFERFDYK